MNIVVFDDVLLNSVESDFLCYFLALFLCMNENVIITNDPLVVQMMMTH